jgi:2-polyprenyl-3-methyl-5-hydroxy-6-metoxy-1,4-benzoquinol methylase
MFLTVKSTSWMDYELKIKKMEYNVNIKCEVCGNVDTDMFLLRFSRTDFNVVECKNCEFVFIPQFYRQQIPYENYRDDEVLQSVRKGNNYIKFRRHKLRLKLIKHYVNSGKLYDIGVGWGHFLNTAKLLGFEASGVEISELMQHYATNDLKLDVVHDNFFNLSLPHNNWDVATMWDVLEHIEQPDLAVEKVHQILKPGGYFVLQVPQIDSKVAIRQKQNWTMMSIEHINYFSRKSIKTLLESKGFEIVKYKSSYELKLFLMFTVLPWLRRKKGQSNAKVNITNSERQNFFNKVTNLPKFIIWLGLLAHDIIYKSLTCLNFGEEMIVVARKK